MLDVITDRLNKHNIKHKEVQTDLASRLIILDEEMTTLKIEARQSQITSENVGQEMVNFRKDLDYYYEYFDKQCKNNQEQVITYQHDIDKIVANQKKRLAVMEKETRVLINKSEVQEETNGTKET